MSLTDEQLEDVARWLRGHHYIQRGYYLTYQDAANQWNNGCWRDSSRPVVTKRDIMRAAKRARGLWPDSFTWCGARRKGRER